MTPVLCLLVIVWIAVDVVQDDDVSGGQVDTESTSSSGQQEHKDVLVCVKLVDQHDPVVVDVGNVRGSWDASQSYHLLLELCQILSSSYLMGLPLIIIMLK